MIRVIHMKRLRIRLYIKGNNTFVLMIHPWRRIACTFLLLLSFALFEGCKSSFPHTTSKKKTIRKGKPIPCPLKDC